MMTKLLAGEVVGVLVVVVLARVVVETVVVVVEVVGAAVVVVVEVVGAAVVVEVVGAAVADVLVFWPVLAVVVVTTVVVVVVVTGTANAKGTDVNTPAVDCESSPAAASNAGKAGVVARSLTLKRKTHLLLTFCAHDSAGTALQAPPILATSWKLRPVHAEAGWT